MGCPVAPIQRCIRAPRHWIGGACEARALRRPVRRCRALARRPSGYRHTPLTRCGRSGARTTPRATSQPPLPRRGGGRELHNEQLKRRLFKSGCARLSFSLEWLIFRVKLSSLPSQKQVPPDSTIVMKCPCPVRGDRSFRLDNVAVTSVAGAVAAAARDRGVHV